MTEVGLLVAFILGMVANQIHANLRDNDRRKLEALRGKEISVYVCEKTGANDILTDIIKNTGAPAPAAGLPPKFSRDLKTYGRARMTRSGSGEWKA